MRKRAFRTNPSNYLVWTKSNHPMWEYDDYFDEPEEEPKPVIISDCCGVESRDTCYNGTSFSDLKMCPECREHCEFVEE